MGSAGAGDCSLDCDADFAATAVVVGGGGVNSSGSNTGARFLPAAAAVGESVRTIVALPVAAVAAEPGNVRTLEAENPSPTRRALGAVVGEPHAAADIGVVISGNAGWDRIGERASVGVDARSCMILSTPVSSCSLSDV